MCVWEACWAFMKRFCVRVNPHAIPIHARRDRPSPTARSTMPSELNSAISKKEKKEKKAKGKLPKVESFQSVIDIFDGGPTYSVPRDSIQTIVRTAALRFVKGNPVEAPERLISTSSIEGFRATRAKVRIEGDVATIDAGAIEALRLAPDDYVRVRQ